MFRRTLLGIASALLVPIFLQAQPESTSSPSPLEVTVKPTGQPAQRALILEALHGADGIVGGPRGAAARPGLNRTTLISKMKKLGISRPLQARERTAAPTS